jgi:hypothetical protein
MRHIVLLSVFLIGCSSNSTETPADFRTAKERTEEEMKGSVFGKDAIGWKWAKNADEKTVVGDDPLWIATSKIMTEYPISFNNFHARLIQTDWIVSNDKSDLRYRFTVRLLGKSPDPSNIDILMIMEKKQQNSWARLVPDTSIRQALIDKIIMEATRIYDQNKRD